MYWTKNGSIPSQETDGTEGWQQAPSPPTEIPEGKELVWLNWEWIIRDPKPQDRAGFQWNWQHEGKMWVESPWGIAEPVVKPLATIESFATDQIESNNIAGDVMANTINATSGVGIVSTADNTNELILQTNGTNAVSIDSSQNVSFAQTLALGVSNTLMELTLSAAAETVTIAATAATGTVNFDVSTQSILYYTSNASANWTLNIRGSSSTTLNSIMATGQSVTVTHLVTQGGTAYYNSALTVDGTSVTPKWSGGTAPSAGNANSVDVYTYTLIKTGSGSFTVFASQTRYA